MSRLFWNAILMLGGIMVVVSVLRAGPHLFSEGYFTDFGTGFMAGNIMLLVAGSGLIWLAANKRRRG